MSQKPPLTTVPVQFLLYSIRRHVHQDLVYVLHQPVSFVEIPSINRTARQDISRILFTEEERSVGLSNVVPTERVLYIQQPAFPADVQNYASR